MKVAPIYLSLIVSSLFLLVPRSHAYTEIPVPFGIEYDYTAEDIRHNVGLRGEGALGGPWLGPNESSKSFYSTTIEHSTFLGSGEVVHIDKWAFVGPDKDFIGTGDITAEVDFRYLDLGVPDRRGWANLGLDLSAEGGREILALQNINHPLNPNKSANDLIIDKAENITLAIQARGVSNKNAVEVRLRMNEATVYVHAVRLIFHYK